MKHQQFLEQLQMILKLLASRPSLLPHPELPTKGPVMPVPRIVVDASVILKWMLGTDCEPDHGCALRILDDWAAGQRPALPGEDVPLTEGGTGAQAYADAVATSLRWP